MTLAATDPGFMWSVATDRLAYVRSADGAWGKVADTDYPGARQISGGDLEKLIAPATDLPAVEKRVMEIVGPGSAALLGTGTCSLVDKDNEVYLEVGATILAFGLKDAADPSKGIEVKRSLDMATAFPPFSVAGEPAGVKLVGNGTTYDGHIVVGAVNGVAVVHRSFSRPAQVHIIKAAQRVSNSFSIDERNGIYLASGSLTPSGDGPIRIKLGS